MRAVVITALAAVLLSGAAEPRRVLRALDAEGSMSRDGRLAFVSTRDGTGYQVFTATADGKDLKQLTRDAGDKDTPSWSADGRTLVFVWEKDGNADIFTIDAAGGEPRRLTSSPHNDIHPLLVTGRPTDRLHPLYGGPQVRRGPARRLRDKRRRLG